MAGSGKVVVPPDSTGANIDCTSISAGGTTVMRQRVVIADPTQSAGFAVVTAGSLQVFVKNASVAVSGQVSVTGSVAVSSLPNVNISAMPAVSLAAGVANIGSINNISATVNVAVTNQITIANISATVNVAGTLAIGSLATGTNNIGTVGISSGTLAMSGRLDGISATVNVAVTNSVNVNNISATVTTITSGFLEASAGSTTTVRVGDSANSAIRVNVVAGISSTAVCVMSGAYDSSSGSTTTVRFGDSANSAIRVNVVAGGATTVSLGPLAAGTNNIGTVGISSGTLAMSGRLDGISATVNVAVTNQINIGNISSTVNVAGTFTIGTIDKISATVTVAGVVQLGGQSAGYNVFIQGGVFAGTAITTASLAVVVVGGSDGTNARFLKTDATGSLVINNISATVNVAGSLTIGGTAGGVSATAGSSFTLIGGMDGSLARGLLMDAAGHAIISGTVALAAGAANIGTVNNISAAVTLAAGTNLIGAVSNAPGTALMGAVSLAAGTANIGFINGISANVNVVLQAGANNIGTINNISAAITLANGATVNISTMPSVVLATGTNNIGTIQAISAPVTLANGATVNISTMPSVVLATGTNNIGTIQAISAPITLANGATVNISTMPTVNVNIAAQSANFIMYMQGGLAFNASVTAGNAPMLMGGRVKTSISTTATAHAACWAWFDKAGHQIVQLNAASLHPSATHGPKTVTLSASANTVLVASAGTACVFVDSLIVTSNLAGVTRCDIYETASSAAPEVSGYLAIGGGGFTHKFDPPWQLSAGQALSARLKPSASAQVLVMVHFHVGPA